MILSKYKGDIRVMFLLRLEWYPNDHYGYRAYTYLNWQKYPMIDHIPLGLAKPAILMPSYQPVPHHPRTMLGK